MYQIFQVYPHCYQWLTQDTRVQSYGDYSKHWQSMDYKFPVVVSLSNTVFYAISKRRLGGQEAKKGNDCFQY